MTFFKNLVVATALFNVALSSTDYSSAPAPSAPMCITSVQTVTFTSIEFSSTPMCETHTVVVTPTVTVTLLPPGGTEGASTAESSAADPTGVPASSVPTSDSGRMSILPIGPPTPVPTSSAMKGSWTISTSLFHHSHTHGTANSTEVPTTMASPTMSVPYPLNSTTAAPATGTNGASVSESASASFSAPPEFTAAAGAVNMATAALFGGIVLAFFGV